MEHPSSPAESHETREQEGKRLMAALEVLSKSCTNQDFKNKIDDAYHTIRRSIEGGADKQAA